MKNILKPQDFEVDTLLKKMTIRRIKSKDFSQLFKLAGDAFKKEEEVAGSRMERLLRLAKFYRVIEVLLPAFDLLHINLETILVAVSDNKLIGEAHISPVGKRIWSLDSIAVDRMFRRHGVYKKLLNESLNYIRERGGRKMVQSIWTDNVASLKMANRLEFRVYAEKILLKLRIRELPADRSNMADVSIRKMKQSDVKRVYQMSKVLDQEMMETPEIAPKNLVDLFIDYLKRRITWTHSERLVMERETDVAGYIHITYNPPLQAGEIKCFYVISDKESSDSEVFLLGKALHLLRKNNIKKVTTFLNKNRNETIGIFEQSRFRPVVSVYEMVKELT